MIIFIKLLTCLTFSLIILLDDMTSGHGIGYRFIVMVIVFNVVIWRWI